MKKLIRCFKILIYSSLTIGLLLFIILLRFLYIFWFQKDYAQFDYPIYGNIYPYVQQIRAGQIPDVQPITFHNYTFLYPQEDVCLQKVDLVFVVKSALTNFYERSIVRQTWGDENRFLDVKIKTVFILGVGDESDDQLKSWIDAEMIVHKDLVIVDFRDSYYNNTIKTIMALKWGVSYCKSARYFALVDDDIYLSTKNLLMFLRDPKNYPETIKDNFIFNTSRASNDLTTTDFFGDRPTNEILYAGK